VLRVTPHQQQGQKPRSQEAKTAIVHHPVHQSSSTVFVSGPDRERISVTQLVGASQIGDEDFVTALRQTIEQSGLFAHVLNDKTAKYQLRAVITHIDRTYFGFDMTTSMEVDYTLSRNESTQVVWHKAITSSYTAPFRAALHGNARTQLAAEGAARNNIEQAIQEMSKLGLE